MKSEHPALKDYTAKQIYDKLLNMRRNGRLDDENPENELDEPEAKKAKKNFSVEQKTVLTDLFPKEISGKRIIRLNNIAKVIESNLVAKDLFKGENFYSDAQLVAQVRYLKDRKMKGKK